MLRIEIEVTEPEGEVYGYDEDGTELGLITIYVTQSVRRGTWKAAGRLDAEHLDGAIRAAVADVAKLEE